MIDPDDPYFHYVDNPTMSGLNEPVCLSLTYVNEKDYDDYQENPEKLAYIENKNIDILIKELRKKGFPAVSEDSPLAADPATVVVTQSGVQTPFVAPDQAQEIALKLVHAIIDSKEFVPMSNVCAVRAEQLTIPTDDPKKIYHRQPLENFKHLQYPVHVEFERLKHDAGFDFVDRMCEKALTKGHTEDDVYRQIGGETCLFAGRKFGADPFYVYALNNLESRQLVYATKNITKAVSYCQDTNLVRRTHKHAYGFLFVYRQAQGQKYFPNYGMERGLTAGIVPDDCFETAVVPGVNEFVGIYLHVEGKLLKLDPAQEDDKYFMEAHRASYICDNPHLIKRRLKILEDYILNKRIDVYDFDTYELTDLDPNIYQKEEDAKRAVEKEKQAQIKAEKEDASKKLYQGFRETMGSLIKRVQLLKDEEKPAFKTASHTEKVHPLHKGSKLYR